MKFNKDKVMAKKPNRSFPHKLTVEDAWRIKYLYPTTPPKELAKKHGVSVQSIYKIRNGENYSWL